MANTFDIPALTESLRPFRLHFFGHLPSTNDKAIEMRRQGELFAPAIILTARQTAGRGRGTNRWVSPPGSLTVTFVLPVEENLQPHQLPLVVGLAVRNAATELTGSIEISLKWPNDVLHADHKLAGLLCERVNQVDIIGIGINVNNAPPALPGQPKSQATSLSAIAGRQFDLSAVLALLTRHLQHLLTSRHSKPFATFVADYRQHDALLGKTISVTIPGEGVPVRGTCEGIDAEGRLLLRSRGRLHSIIAGSVSTA